MAKLATCAAQLGARPPEVARKDATLLLDQGQSTVEGGLFLLLARRGPGAETSRTPCLVRWLSRDWRQRGKAAEKAREIKRSTDTRPERVSYFTPSSSTSKIKVALGGMSLPAPSTP